MSKRLTYGGLTPKQQSAVNARVPMRVGQECRDQRRDMILHNIGKAMRGKAGGQIPIRCRGGNRHKPKVTLAKLKFMGDL